MVTTSLYGSFLRSGMFKQLSDNLVGSKRSAKILGAALAVSGVFLCGPKPAHAFGLSLTHGYPNGVFGYNLTWDAVTPSTTGATVIYYVFQDFGFDLNSGFPTFGNAVDVVQTPNAVEHFGFGSRCFIVVSSDSAGGPSFFSNGACHNFLHNLGSETVGITDGDGTLRGVNQTWKITYSMDQDAYVTAQIYPPGTRFTGNANGFIVSASSPIVKTLVLNTPRPGETANISIQNSETWDCRSDTGTVVPNGIYYFLISATLDSGQLPNPPRESTVDPTLESLLRGSLFISIPVDILRVMNFATTGITLSNPVANISYDLTGDALVRLVIAQPGSHFTVDANGDIQPINAAGAIDTTLIVSTSTFQRKAGHNVESWNGTSSTGAVVGSGVYESGISAKDAFGNHALDSSGNNNRPIFTTITVERSVGSVNTNPTSSTPPTLTSITPANGSSVTSAVQSVSVVLSGATTLNLAGTSFAIRDPNNNAVIPQLSNNGSNTVTATFNPPLSTNGTYTMTIIAFDTLGNSSTFSENFTINLGLASGSFGSTVTMFPNPAKGMPATIQYTLGVPSVVDLDIFNVMGERVYNTSFNDLQGTNQHLWNLTNNGGAMVGSGLYLVRLHAHGGGAEAKVVKKLVVVQ